MRNVTGILGFCILMLINVDQLKAQSTGSESPYVFPAFTSGRVLQKNGASLTATLNYNLVTQELLFEQEGKRIVLGNADVIDTVYLNERKFIPARQVFFEKLTETSVALFVQPKGKISVRSNNSQQNNRVVSDNYKKTAAEKPDHYNIQLPSGYIIINESTYWLQKGAQFIPFNNFKKLTDLFPARALAIEEYIVSNGINLNKREDLIKLVTFANQ